MIRRSIDPSTARGTEPRAKRSLGRALAVAALLALLAPGVALAQGGHSGHGTAGSATTLAATFAARDYAFDGPTELTAGWQDITLANLGAEMHHLQFARLNDGVTPDQFFEALAAEGEAALRLATMTGGVGMIPPGSTGHVLADFTQPGDYVLLCFLPNAEGTPHLALGMTDVLTVVGEAADASEPAADLEVHMSDFAFDIPATLPAGEQTWKVINDGPQPHEMIVVKLNQGVSFDQFMAELEANGESAMPGRPMGGAQALNVDRANFLTYDLEPGEYAALCFVPDAESGEPHVELGMAAGFTVAEAQAAY